MLIRTPNDLGAAIRHHRRQRGLDQQALARRIGVSRQWVIEIEKGKPRAEIGLVLRALHALGIALSITSAQGSAEGRAATGVNIDDIVEQAREPDP